jgi:hypothetical protein
MGHVLIDQNSVERGIRPTKRKRAVVAHGQRRTFLEFCARREEQPC